MKKIIQALTALFAAAVLFMTILPAAGAAGYPGKAGALNRMGLFLGTDVGYELDRVPTRAEAAVMLVRLLGQEDAAQAGVYGHPFNDVPDWALPYVGYLYERGLTKGTSASTFEPQIVCSAQMYTTFVLRALGYTEENGSFTYDGATTFAEQLGLMLFDDASDFQRDDMVALSYSALFQLRQNSTDTLLDKLIADGAVIQADARSELEKYAIYQDYLNACRSGGLAGSNRLFSSVYVFFSFNGQPINYRHTHNVRTVIDGSTLTLRSEDAISGTQYADSDLYYADGWLYMRSGDDKVKVRIDLNAGDYAPEDNLGVQPFYRVRDIYETVENGGTRFTVFYERGAYSAVLENFMPLLGGMVGPKNVYKNGLRIETCFDADGQLTIQTIEGNIVTENTDKYYALNIDIIGETNLAETGDAVQITPPDDLDAYVDIDTLS